MIYTLLNNKKDLCITGELEKPIIKKKAVTEMVVNKSSETEVEHENVKTEGSNEKVKANIAGKLASSQDIEHENVKTEGSNEKVKANIAGKLASSQEKMSHGQFRR